MTEAVGGSFRDPAGFVYRSDGVLFRLVRPAGREDYERLMSSGLYRRLTEAGLLVPHVEEPEARDGAHKVLRPEPVPFVSYPYEWCFSQLKDAALATLRIQRLAMESGMSLRDASSYNIQFRPGRGPVLIDTLSFEDLEPGRPWVAYRQFCQHFLAPLALMAHAHPDSNRLLMAFIDGVPLDMASAMLPARTRLRFGLLTHIHLHAGAKRREGGSPRAVRLGPNALAALVDSLEATVRGLHWAPTGTTWGAYAQEHNYTARAFTHKRELVERFLSKARPASVWDLGANDGHFSRVASAAGIPTVAWDMDAAAVDLDYRRTREAHETNLLPLRLDLTNPSPALGWNHHERDSLLQRGPADLVMALALVHHLAIGNNVPLDRVASFLAQAGHRLIIEFVPKDDPQVVRMLAEREDVFPAYHREGFEQAFAQHFRTLDREAVAETPRTLYLMERLEP